MDNLWIGLIGLWIGLTGAANLFGTMIFPFYGRCAAAPALPEDRNADVPVLHLATLFTPEPWAPKDEVGDVDQ